MTAVDGHGSPTKALKGHFATNVKFASASCYLASASYYLASASYYLASASCYLASASY